MTEPARDALLTAAGVEHAFGVRDMREPEGICRPRQVHGVGIVSGRSCAGDRFPDGDGVVSSDPGRRVGVVTADCVPLLLATGDLRAVAAVHAGWRGLAAGVVAAGVQALCAESGSAPGDLIVAVGPHIGVCCYEVDEPVLKSLGARFPTDLQGALRSASRPGHAMLDLAQLVRDDLYHCGLQPTNISGMTQGCTFCEVDRFYSYRREGPRSGRLLHFIAAGTGSQG
ncbi:peptidoglycan editing factor PgeF [Myxococcota bacterium]|nr:peptidoglycan editing factor PgeF [Myxococcota bacterium]